jgi:hypothetical protein
MITRMKKTNKLNFAIFFLFFTFTFINNAYAYLDPGTGAMIFQVIIAGVLGSLFVFKLFYRRIIRFLKNLFKGKKSDNDNEC